MWDRITEWAVAYAGQVVGAIVTLVLGYLVARVARRLVRGALRRTKTLVELQAFVARLVYVAILIFAVIATLARFGIETTSLVAVLGAVAFAIGFALQGSLSNFAAGVLLLILRPFRVGDYIEVAGVAGTVKDIQLFTTILSTLDNIKVLVPNSKICGETVRNLTGYEARVVDVPVGIAYSASIETASAVATGVVSGDPRVHKEPAPQVLVGALAESRVNLIVRMWASPADYWGVLFDMTRRIKEAFDEQGIEIPLPQRVVHMSRE